MIARRPSPNCGPRRDGARPDLVVLHYTAMCGAEDALARLCDPAAEVSAHYVITEIGAVFQLVEEAERAWHAGAGAWGDVADVNSRSIGIELVNTGVQPFALPQMRALEGLLGEIRVRWDIPPERVIGHSDMAVGRKSDPGARFDWAALARAGHAIWPKGTLGDDAARDVDFAAALARIGYRVPASEDGLAAFRLRFRPWGEGPLAPQDCALAEEVARHWPCRAG